MKSWHWAVLSGLGGVLLTTLILLLVLLPKGGDAETYESTRDAAYLEIMRDVGMDGTDQDKIEVGRNICRSLEAGNSWFSVLGAVLDNGFEPYQAGQVMGAATAAYCPAHAYRP